MPCFLRKHTQRKITQFVRMFKKVKSKTCSLVDIIPITVWYQYIKTKRRGKIWFCTVSVFIWLCSVRIDVDFSVCPIRKELQSGPSPVSIYNRCTRNHWATSRFKTRRAPPNPTGSWSVSSSTRPVPPPSNAGCSHCKVIHNLDKNRPPPKKKR